MICDYFISIIKHYIGSIVEGIQNFFSRVEM